MTIKIDMWDRKIQQLKEENKTIAKTIKCTYTGKCNMKGRMCQCCSYYKPKEQRKSIKLCKGILSKKQKQNA